MLNVILTQMKTQSNKLQSLKFAKLKENLEVSGKDGGKNFEEWLTLASRK